PQAFGRRSRCVVLLRHAARAQPYRRQDMNRRLPLIKNLALGAGLVIAVCLLSTFAIVPAGHRGVLTTFGKVDERVYGEGFYFRWPVAQAMHLIDVRIQKGEGEGEAASKDLQVVHT